MNIICGIYKITSPSKKIYIGQSINILRRWNYHYKTLKCKEQTKLYYSLLKYGYTNHKFEIIHICKPEELNELEIYYIDLYQSFNSEHGLNLHSGGINHICSDETRLKISIAGTKRKHSDETKKKMSESAKKHIRTQEHCDNIRKSKQNISQETREKLRQANLGKKYTDEVNKKKGRAGRILSKETCQKISESHKGKKRTK